MDNKGHLIDYKDVQRLTEDQQKKFREVPSADVAEVKTMNRADRRAYFRKNKHKMKLVSKDDL